jgi:hypothetical protein
MANDWSPLWQSLISAASGLGGVWLGGRLTWKREESRESDRIKKESGYLAILVVAHLDRFVNGCLQVSFDDGTGEGRPAGADGYHQTTVSSPKFDPLALDFEWKVLPADLMYGILNLPYRTEQLENDIANTSENDDPPDYAETFWTRQHGFAVLGLEVSELARKLRLYAGLPIDAPADGGRSRDDLLREQRDKFVDARAAYDLSRAASYSLIEQALLE